jgi:hypothetical protein
MGAASASSNTDEQQHKRVVAPASSSTGAQHAVCMAVHASPSMKENNN